MRRPRIVDISGACASTLSTTFVDAHRPHAFNNTLASLTRTHSPYTHSHHTPITPHPPPKGPPESVRDHIMAATRSLLAGDWAAAYAFIEKLPVWVLVPQREVRRGAFRLCATIVCCHLP
jgi:hypothetical protein